jgi:hypothetical protein
MTQPVAPTTGPPADPAKPGEVVAPTTGAPANSPAGDEDEIDVDAADFDIEKAKKAISKKNREAQNLRKRLTDVEPLLTEFTQWKESQKTEEQRRTEVAEAQLFELASAKEQLARQTACLKAGFSPEEIVEFAGRLRGEDEDSLVEDAKRLKTLLNPTGVRRADPSQGRGNQTPSSPAALFGQMLKKDN